VQTASTIQAEPKKENDMKANQIEVGKTYLIRHHGEISLARVRVDAIRTSQFNNRVYYDCTKLSTGRSIRVKSASKFRREAPEGIKFPKEAHHTHPISTEDRPTERQIIDYYLRIARRGR
jgi:hypothetical protein